MKKAACCFVVVALMVFSEPAGAGRAKSAFLAFLAREILGIGTNLASNAIEGRLKAAVCPKGSPWRTKYPEAPKLLDCGDYVGHDTPPPRVSKMPSERPNHPPEFSAPVLAMPKPAPPPLVPSPTPKQLPSPIPSSASNSWLLNPQGVALLREADDDDRNGHCELIAPIIRKVSAVYAPHSLKTEEEKNDTTEEAQVRDAIKSRNSARYVLPAGS